MQNKMNDRLLSLMLSQTEKNDERIPFYVFHIDELSDHLRKIKQEAKSVQVYFSLKSNPMLISVVDHFVDGFEISSGGGRLVYVKGQKFRLIRFLLLVLQRQKRMCEKQLTMECRRLA